MKNIEIPQQKPFKVLIVDSDVNSINALEKILFTKNYTIYSVSSGKEALEKISKMQPDIILIETSIPDMDGYQLCDEIKNDERYFAIPVLFITEKLDSDIILKAFEHNAVDFIVKPFNSKVILARIDTHLKIKKSQEVLQELNMVKMKFFSIVTQDIKDSLIGVKGIADFLVQDLEEGNDKSTEGIKMAKILQDDSRRLYELLENLIEWASIEAGQIQINPEEINISDFINNTSKVCDNYICNKELKLTINCPADIKLMTDAKALRIIFLKILSNAIKYSNRGGEINITVNKKNGNCIFKIADQGVGMDADVVRNIFKLDTPHPKTIGTSDEKGTGLGLIICNSLIEKLSGSISIDSKKFRGATVKFEIPDFEQ